MPKSDLIQASYEVMGNEAVLHGDGGCGKIAVSLDDVTVENGALRVTEGTVFRLVAPATDQLPDDREAKLANSKAHNVYSTTCMPFGAVSYLYECLPGGGLKYIGPCGMPGNCAYPCTG